MFNLIHFIQDTYIKIKYSKYYYKPTRAGFEAYKRYISKSYIAPHVLPPASSSQIISLLSLSDLPTFYSKYDWTYCHCNSDAFYLFYYWDDFKDRPDYYDFFDWANKMYNTGGKDTSYRYSTNITYNAVIFNPATLLDFCRLYEFIESERRHLIFKYEETKKEQARLIQLRNLKTLTSYLQSLQDEDKMTFEKVLNENTEIQNRLK